MNLKLQLLKHTIALWTLLSLAISMLIMFLLSWPLDILPQVLWLIMVIFLANAILYGVGMWVWYVRIYLKSKEPEKDGEPADVSEQEAWGV